MAAAVKKAAPAQQAEAGINFGDLNMYTGGSFLPEGDYVAKDHKFMMFKGEKSNIAERLGVMITFAPLDAPSEDKTSFYSMGSNAHKSFAPNPVTGKGIVAVPGGAGTTLNESTNWAVYLKSLYDSGLPQGILSDDIGVLDGMHVHIANIPEPENRKGFRAAQTGEAAMAGNAAEGTKTISVVTEIKDDGKPWEGSGGVPEAPKGKPNGKPGKATPAPAKPAVAKAEPEAEQEDVEVTAINAVTAELEKKPEGMGKLILRTSVFKAIEDKEVAKQVLDTYFATDDALNGVLEQLGYKVAAGQVKPV